MQNKNIFGMGLLCLFMVFALTAPSFGHSPASIPVIGTDDEGQPIEEVIPGAEYSQKLQTLVTSVNDSMMEALVTQNSIAQWKLTTIVVGVGVSAEVGLGPIIKVKATPRFRVAFSKNDEPILP